MVEIVTFLHASLLIANLETSRAFYEGGLGLVPSPKRPTMSFEGVWYDIGSQQIHLMVLPDPDKNLDRPEHGGRDYHIALGVKNFEALRAALEKTNISYTLSRSGRNALFCRDPDGNALEFVEVS